MANFEPQPKENANSERDAFSDFLKRYHGEEHCLKEHDSSIPKALTDEQLMQLFFLRRRNARLRERIVVLREKLDRIAIIQAQFNRFQIS